jgi:two-component system chemotaxis response regulator CheB
VRLINADGIVRDVVVIGASAGGIEAMEELLSFLPSNLPAAIGFVNHRSPAPSNWASMLGKRSRLHVSEPANGERLILGHAYIAPADCHMRFHEGFIFLDRSAKQHHVRPALDPLFESAALTYGPRVVGAVLSGGGADGTDGLRCVWERGGLCLVQSNPEYPWMTKHALAHDHVSAAFSIANLAEAIVLLASGSSLRVADSAKARVSARLTRG